MKFPERNYIIDAKVSLADWTKYVEAVKSNTEEDKKLSDKYFKKRSRNKKLGIKTVPRKIKKLFRKTC